MSEVTTQTQLHTPTPEGPDTANTTTVTTKTNASTNTNPTTTNDQAKEQNVSEQCSEKEPGSPPPPPPMGQPPQLPQSDNKQHLAEEVSVIEIETPYSPSQAPTFPSTSNSSKVTTVVKQEDESGTPRPTKRSRKSQGAGVKKPLYTRYESLFIIKSYKTILDHQPNLVLIDLFKIVAILFNEEAKRQGFKERTADQLYQKYKRIQHGLNHGELEFLKFFKQNKYNPKEWIPNFRKVGEDEEDPLKFIKFPRLHEAMTEILGKEQISDETMDIDAPENYSQESDPEDQLLKLAGYNDNDDTDDIDDDENYSKINDRAKTLINDLRAKVKYLEARLKFKDEEISTLKEGNTNKEREIEFLKEMVKEDLSYIRHKVKGMKE